LVFGRDMVVPIPFNADWRLIQQRKQRIIEDSNRKENSKRTDEYLVGDQVLIEHGRPGPKISRRTEGPFEVAEVFANGTVDVQRNAAVRERINIRRIRPYHRRHN
ncbi:MAG: hypothetical protein ACREOZ_01900, partial [Gloeomargaritales cyanobacterium]